MPFHLLWQNMPLAFKPADTYLSDYHAHFDAKLWANLHLSHDTRIAWTSDNEFYYLEQPAVSIQESAIVRTALATASSPAERVRALCDLGFEVLAWEDREHGPEAAGLYSWLKLGKRTLHSSDDVTFFDLRCPTERAL